MQGPVCALWAMSTGASEGPVYIPDLHSLLEDSLRSGVPSRGGGYTHPSGASLWKGTADSSRRKGVASEGTMADTVLDRKRPSEEVTQGELICLWGSG